MLASDPNLLHYFRAARAAGCPQDQVETFVKFAYGATPEQLTFHALARAADKADGPVDIVITGTRGSAKSHAIIAQACLDDCQRAPGLKGLFLRKTAKAAAESFEDLIGRVCLHTRHKLNQDGITFANGARCIIGGYSDQADIDNYIGQEYDFIVIEERNQLQGERVDKLKGSLRTSKTGWRPRLYSSTNPGGIGHNDTKKLFGIGSGTTAKAGHVRLSWSYLNNPFIDTGYTTWLEGLEGILARMWREDDWDIFAGQAFPELSFTKHGCRQVPVGLVYLSGDYGTAKPYSIGKYVLDNDGNITRAAEIYGYGGHPNIGTRETAEEIIRRVKAELLMDIQGNEIRPEAFYVGPDWFDAGGAKSVAEIFGEHRLYLTKITTPAGSRVQGKRLFHQRLADGTFRVHESCVHWWRTVPELVYSEVKPEDINTDQEDHSFDETMLFLRAHTWAPKLPGLQPEPDIIERMRARGLEMQYGGKL